MTFLIDKGSICSTSTYNVQYDILYKHRTATSTFEYLLITKLCTNSGSVKLCIVNDVIQRRESVKTYRTLFNDRYLHPLMQQHIIHRGNGKTEFLLFPIFTSTSYLTGLCSFEDSF
jgi:hypothetical protein